jgi:histidinol dehydrogenase
MKIIRHTDLDFAAQLQQLIAPSSLFDPVIEERTRSIIGGVRDRGDQALIEFTRRFDRLTLSSEQFCVTKAEFLGASVQADESLRDAVAVARRNVETFARRSLRKNWAARNAQGARVGEKFDPFQRVGVYIPGGTRRQEKRALLTRRCCLRPT